jgi:hypothetical protein
MKSGYLSLLIGIVLFLILGAFSFQEPKSESGFENLKVLPKNIGEEELDSIMDVFCISLGVKCSFCHVRVQDQNNSHLDFANDGKDEKITAREMIRMTIELNEKFFNHDNSDRPDTIHEIVCYTCHRGVKAPHAGPFISLVDSILKGKPKK